MDKNKIQIMVTVVLVVVLILVSINSFNRIKRKLPPKSSPKAMPAETSELQPVSAPAVSEQERQTKYAQVASMEWMRDPFHGKIYLSAKGDIDLKISGILWDEKKPSAIISDKIVNEGDTIGKYTVIKIEKESVILNDGVKNVELVIGK